MSLQKSIEHVAVALCVAAAMTAQAVDYTVTSNLDSGAGTLRNLVNAAVDGDRIFFDSGVAKITLSGADILVNDSIQIIGNGVVLDGNGASRIFTVNSLADSMLLSGLVFTNGSVATTGGGAIYGQAADQLTITNCLFAGCQAVNVNGGALYLVGVTNTLIVDSRFERCGTTGGVSGGAINFSAAPPRALTVLRCTFIGNQTAGTSGGGGGGGIFTGGGATTVLSSLFSNNVCAAGWGGGIGSTGASSTTFVKDTLFVDNYARQGGGLGARTYWIADGCTFLRNVSIVGGGAVADYSGVAGSTWSARNCLFVENSTTNSAAPAYGGAIYTRECIAVVSNCVFRGNSDRNGTATGGNGGALAAYSTAGSITLYSSLFEGNRSLGAGGACYVGHAATFVDCSFVTNSCVTDGGAFYGVGTNTPTVSYAKEFRNCTFSGNVAGDGTGDNGGAIYIASGDLRVYGSTIVTNRGQGAGIFINAGNTNAYLTSCIVAGNVDTVSLALNDLQGAFQEIDYCLIQESPASYTLADATPVGNLAAGTNPKLESLADNGGPALPGGFALLTHALAKDSPAVNAGSNPLALPYDQRGVGNSRESPVGEPDIGAFEYVAPPPGNTVLIVR